MEPSACVVSRGKAQHNKSMPDLLKQCCWPSTLKAIPGSVPPLLTVVDLLPQWYQRRG
jgi:hypothetical protein